MKTEPLFPDMEREILDERRAERRERKQRAVDYLRKRDISWLINTLLEKGPQTEVGLISSVMNEDYRIEDFTKRVGEILFDLSALHVIGKLWRKDQGIHMGSGERSYLFGIRKVHPQP